MAILSITARTRPETLAKAASAGTPVPLRLSKRLSGSNLHRILTAHRHAAYGEELAELLLSSPSANAALIEAALRRYPRALGVKNAAATSKGASRRQLVALARSRHRSVRQHAKLNLLSSSLARASARRFREAVTRARRSRDPAQLYIIAVHPDLPRSVLLELADAAPDFVRDTARIRLRRTEIRRAR